MLTRKVFEQVAASVKKSVDKADETLDANLYGFAAEMANELADYFQKENPRFDRDRFLDACGLGSRILASEHVCRVCCVWGGRAVCCGPLVPLMSRAIRDF